jgi:hypothetical protein
MRLKIDRCIHYAVLSGFLLLVAGIITSIVRSGMPIEITLIAVGILLLVVGFLMAKVFGEYIERWR